MAMHTRVPDADARQFARSCFLVAVTPLALLAAFCAIDFAAVRWPSAGMLADIAWIAWIAIAPFAVVLLHWRWQLPNCSSVGRAFVTGVLALMFGFLLSVTVGLWFHVRLGGML